MIKLFVIYLVVINSLTFVLYGIDKIKAKTDRWRIKEAMLISLAAVGGAFGALAGMYLFHHKTRKAKFFITIPFFAVVYTFLLIWFIK